MRIDIDIIYLVIVTHHFPKFVPELWPFIYAKISFPLNILRTTRNIFFPNFVYALILTRSSLGLLHVIYRKYGTLFTPKVRFHSIS